MKYKRIIHDFWDENYITTAKENVGNETIMNISLCGLCGNTGIINTTETAISPRGSRVGGKFFCLCPNGRKMKQRDE